MSLIELITSVYIISQGANDKVMALEPRGVNGRDELN